MKRILILLIVLVGTGNAAVSPYWDNPVEVPEAGEREVTLEIFNPFQGEDYVTISKEGNLENTNLSQSSFTLDEGESQEITLTIGTNDQTRGATFNGTILIEHSTQASANTGVETREAVSLDTVVVSQEGLFPGGPAGGILTTIGTLVLICIIIGIATGVIRMRKDGEIEWRM